MARCEPRSASVTRSKRAFSRTWNFARHSSSTPAPRCLAGDVQVVRQLLFGHHDSQKGLDAHRGRHLADNGTRRNADWADLRGSRQQKKVKRARAAPIFLTFSLILLIRVNPLNPRSSASHSLHQPRTRTPPLRRKTISTSLRPKSKTIRSRRHFLTFTLPQPDGSVKQTLTGQFVNGCSSTTLCVPQVGWNEQTNSLTVSGRAGPTGMLLPGRGTGCAGGAISSGTPGGGCTSTGGGTTVRCTGTTTGGPPTRIRTGPPRMMTSARASAATTATTRANAQQGRRGAPCASSGCLTT